MATSENVLTATVDDYLLSLADSVCTAQQKLNQTVIPGQFGQPATMYQIPQLEFELKMSFEIQQSLGGAGSIIGGSSAGDDMVTKLKVRPVTVQGAGERGKASVEAASIIKGKFVAVPAERGKPPSIVTSSLEKAVDDPLGKRHKITVEAKSAAGELLDNVEVHFNLDRVLSKMVNEAHDIKPYKALDQALLLKIETTGLIKEDLAKFNNIDKQAKNLKSTLDYSVDQDMTAFETAYQELVDQISLILIELNTLNDKLDAILNGLVKFQDQYYLPDQASVFTADLETNEIDALLTDFSAAIAASNSKRSTLQTDFAAKTANIKAAVDTLPSTDLMIRYNVAKLEADPPTYLGNDLADTLDADSLWTMASEVYSFADNTGITKGVVYTENGLASTELIIGTAEKADTKIAIVIDVLGETETIVYKV